MEYVHVCCLRARPTQSIGAGSEGVVGPGAVQGSAPAPAPPNEGEESTTATGADSVAAGLESAFATTLSTPATCLMSEVNSAT